MSSEHNAAHPPLVLAGPRSTCCTDPSNLSAAAQLLKVSDSESMIWCGKDGGTALLKATVSSFSESGTGLSQSR